MGCYMKYVLVVGLRVRRGAKTHTKQARKKIENGVKIFLLDGSHFLTTHKIKYIF